MQVYIEDVSRHVGQPVTIRGWLATAPASSRP
jgi:hypothetical protein